MSRVLAHPAPGRCRARGAAFTLIELLIVSVILLVVGAGLLTAFLSGQASYLSADASIQIQQEARRAFDNVIRELREAGGSPAKIGPLNVNTQQLDFQTALAYNSADAGCDNVNQVCYGAKNQSGAQLPGSTVRYLIVPSATDPTIGSLVRITMTGGIEVDRRVLGNNVDTQVAASFFNWNSGNKTITVSLRFVTSAVQNTQLAGGARSSGATPLTAQIRLRN